MRQSPDELLSQLKAVTGPEGVPATDRAAPPGWFFILAMVFISGMFWWRWRKRRTRRPPSAIKEAQLSLANLAGRPDAHELCRIARRFLGRMYWIDADRLTNNELKQRLPDQAALHWLPVLDAADRYRFGGAAVATDWLNIFSKVEELIMNGRADSSVADAGQTHIKSR